MNKPTTHCSSSYLVVPPEHLMLQNVFSSYTVGTIYMIWCDDVFYFFRIILLVWCHPPPP